MKMARARIAAVLGTWLAGFVLSACTIQSSISNHYLTAEKLWTQKNYAAAVVEFDGIVKETPNTALGLQALWRASTTRTLFLGEHEEALHGFETFYERAQNSDLAPQALKEVGEIYFSRLNQYQNAIDHYQKLTASGKFGKEDEALFLYRIARSYFQLGRIRRSIEVDQDLIAKYPDSPLVARAKLDLANGWYAIGDSDKQGYTKALLLFQEIVLQSKTDPSLRTEAIFGEASVREELDELEKAHELFKSIERTYPTPNVIRIRLVRLEERLKKKRK